MARLKRPTGFKGPPLFADDRSVFPETDRVCQIKQDKNDAAELAFDLRITDFSRCGVLKRNVSTLFISIHIDVLRVPLGFCSRAYLVSAIPWSRHAIRPRAHYHVQTTGTNSHRKQGGWLCR